MRRGNQFTGLSQSECSHCKCLLSCSSFLLLPTRHWRKGRKNEEMLVCRIGLPFFLVYPPAPKSWFPRSAPTMLPLSSAFVPGVVNFFQALSLRVQLMHHRPVPRQSFAQHSRFKEDSMQLSRRGLRGFLLPQRESTAVCDH